MQIPKTLDISSRIANRENKTTRPIIECKTPCLALSKEFLSPWDVIHLKPEIRKNKTKINIPAIKSQVIANAIRLVNFSEALAFVTGVRLGATGFCKLANRLNMISQLLYF
jgi:hypothetical protein